MHVYMLEEPLFKKSESPEMNCIDINQIVLMKIGVMRRTASRSHLDQSSE